MIELYATPTPNGQKVMIMLEEIGLAWQHIDVNIRTGEQFSAEHLKRSPNNKIPAIVDTEGPGGSYTMMESGAILIYLAEKTGDEYTIANMAVYPWVKGYADRRIDKADHPRFMRWLEAMEARPAVRRNNTMTTEIRARMNKAAEGKPPVNIYDTKDNAERLAKATGS